MHRDRLVLDSPMSEVTEVGSSGKKAPLLSNGDGGGHE